MHQSYEPYDQDQTQQWTKAPRLGSITDEDKRSIMKHVPALFGLAPYECVAGASRTGSITEEDRNLIVWNIDELFLV
jgi:hypothetical protein